MHPAQLLVVDDDPIVLDSLKELLSLEGYSVSTADSLSGARGELKQRQFHTVLLDVRLPDGNGLELVEEIGATSAAVIM
ncbi:MAG: response regulator, partial [Planctomycetes bacterium]|nr:response regulator [Planctomycetota bacterium]